MILRNITWTEKQNTIDYSFDFKEVMQVDITTFDYLYEDIGFSLGTLKQMSLSEMLYGNESDEAMYKMVIQALTDKGYLSRTDVQLAVHVAEAGLLNDLGADAAKLGASLCGLVGIGFVAWAIATPLLALAGGAAATAAIVPVGTLIAIAGLFLIGAIALYTVMENQKKEKALRERGFKLFQNSKDFFDKDGNLTIAAEKAELNISEWNRLIALLDNVKNAINSNTSDLTGYTVSSGIDDNDEREVAIQVGNRLYYIKFTRDDINGWQVNVIDENGDELDGSNGRIFNKGINIYDISQCNRYTNALFIDANQEYEVYLVNASLNPEVNDSDEALNNVKKYLYGTNVLVSKGSIENNMEKIKNTVNNVLTDWGFVDL